MRVSSGRRSPSGDTKMSPKSLEKTISSGSKKINGGGDLTDESVVKKGINTDLENEKKKDNAEGSISEKEKDVSSKTNKDTESRRSVVKESKNISSIVKPEVPMKKLSRGRVLGMVLMGFISSLLIAGVVWGLYYQYIRYPEMAVYDLDNSGLAALNEWVESINTLDNESIKSITGEDSYLANEIEYANDKDYQVDFLKKMVGTVSYEPDEVVALNKYGNPLLDEDDNVVYMQSLVNDVNEKLTIHYIDYSKISLDKAKIKSIMKEVGLNLGDVDYSNRLIEVFCRYMTSLEDEDIPLVSIKYSPNLINDGNGYRVLADEDIFLDRELFSSEKFHALLHRFSLIAGGGSENPEWVAWSKLSDKEKKEKSEPIKILNELQPSKEWVEWNSKEYDERKALEEPEKYDSLNLIRNNWCGSYYLLNEYTIVDGGGNLVKNPISAEVGDGSIDNPAGLNTNIVTSIFVEEKDKKGKLKRVEKPIRVRLVDFKVSQEAIDYFEGKDERNRGFDIKSEIQYTSYSLEITNLSDSKITVYDDSSLSDRLANMSHRTGFIYGLEDSVTLEPQETGIIESWGCSTELNKKYLVWGKNFQREKEVLWFRVLAGNIDDPSEDKGVSLNTSRYDTGEEEE